MTRIRRLAQRGLPFIVSGAILVFLVGRIDTSHVLEHITKDVLTVFLPMLLAFGAVSVWIEAVCIVQLLGHWHGQLDLWTAARIKAASYLLYLVNYALGAFSLTLLLRRRAGIGLADAGGIVMVVALFDLALVIGCAAVGAALTAAETPGPVIGVMAVASIGLIGGFAILRTPRSLGPLERIRSLELFRALRATPPRLLASIGLLRFVFVLLFMTMAWAALAAFDIRPPIGDVFLNIALVTLVSTLPIAVAGLGTGQAAFVYFFRSWGDEGTLLACSLTLSAGLIVMRAAMGFLCSREFAREALQASREAEL